MKGLMIKDFYTILKQMKIFLVMIVVFTCIPNFSAMIFAIVYSIMLPMTAIGYDERSKWDKLAAMMPYSATDIVFSKYILGFMMVLATAVISCFTQAVIGIFIHTKLTGEFFAQLAFIISFALIIEAIELPVLIKFGTEKGRLFIILFLVIVAVGGATLVENLTGIIYHNLNMVLLLPLFAFAAIALSALSAFLAVKLYQSKIQ